MGWLKTAKALAETSPWWDQPKAGEVKVAELAPLEIKPCPASEKITNFETNYGFTIQNIKSLLDQKLGQEPYVGKSGYSDPIQQIWEMVKKLHDDMQNKNAQPVTSYGIVSLESAIKGLKDHGLMMTGHEVQQILGTNGLEVDVRFKLVGHDPQVVHKLLDALAHG